MAIDPGQLDVDSGQLELSMLTEEKSNLATDTTMDNLSQHTMEDDFPRFFHISRMKTKLSIQTTHCLDLDLYAHDRSHFQRW